MHNTEKKVQRVLLVGVDTGSYDAEVSIRELAELAETAGAEIAGEILQKSEVINNATYIGKGKLQEVKEYARQKNVDLLIFDDELSGTQIRNIEEEAGVDVIDRTILILDIFAQRARSNEGKRQVELAQQKYLLPRLAGIGKQLSKQQGGIGSRGPGESKLENDRRHIRRRIDFLEKELEELEKQRGRTRERRVKNNYATIAIVGYTNAGKSTLLNALTGAGVLEKDQLFATLDPTARELKLPNGQRALVVDTVGFLRRLPHQLIQAFHSTLEEAASADIILNVCDISDDCVSEQLEVTRELLNELGCGDIPVITVYNKMDCLGFQPESAESVEKQTVFLSAKTGEGLDRLVNCLAQCLKERVRRVQLAIPYSEAGLLDRLRKKGRVLEETYENDGVFLTALVDRRFLKPLEKYMVK